MNFNKANERKRVREREKLLNRIIIIFMKQNTEKKIWGKNERKILFQITFL